MTKGHFNASRVPPFGGRPILGALMLVLCALCWSDGASAQDLVWGPQQKIAGVGTSSSPSLAVFGDQLYAAWKGVGNDPGIYWSSFDGNAWAAQQRIRGVGTSSSLSLAVFENQLYATWKGVHNDAGIYWSSFDGNPWAAQQKIAGVGTSDSPSLAVFGGQLYSAWKGVGNDPGIYWSSFDGNAWAVQQRIQGVGTAVGPSLAVFENQLYAAWKGVRNDPGIYWSSFDGNDCLDGNAWAAQQRIQGVGTSGSPSLAVFGDQLYAAWKGVAYDPGIYWSQAKPILSVLSPLACERFVQGESIGLEAAVTDPAGGSGNADSVSWFDGSDPLGTGAKLVVSLTSGTHTLVASWSGVSVARVVRVFPDLGGFYTERPAQGEIDRVEGDFTFHWQDGAGPQEQWNAYPVTFDQHSTDPSKLVIVANLDVLRHQDFSEPLPFTGGLTAYERLTKFVHTFDMRLDCNVNFETEGGQVSLNRTSSVWDPRSTQTADSCKKPFSNLVLAPYVDHLYLVMHEERHSEWPSADPGQPPDPGHILCPNNVQCDPYLEGGSGHAWAAMYTMWVYKYGKYDPPAVKTEAKNVATDLLKTRFPTRPTHSNPKVQAIIDELLGPP